MATDIFKHRPPWAPVLDGLESVGRLNVNVARHLKEGDLRGAVEALKDDWQTATGLALVTFALVVAACAPAIDRVIHPTQIPLPEPFPAHLKLEASNETKLLQRFADRFSPDSPNHGPLVLNSESVAAADAIELTTPDKTTTIVVAPAVDAGSVRVADTTYWREEPDSSFQRVSQKTDSGYIIYTTSDGQTLLRMHQVSIVEAEQLTDEQLLQVLGLQIMGSNGQWYSAQINRDQFDQLFPGARKVNAAPAPLDTPTLEPSPTWTLTPTPTFIPFTETPTAIPTIDYSKTGPFIDFKEKSRLRVSNDSYDQDPDLVLIPGAEIHLVGVGALTLVDYVETADENAPIDLLWGLTVNGSDRLAWTKYIPCKSDKIPLVTAKKVELVRGNQYSIGLVVIEEIENSNTFQEAATSSDSCQPLEGILLTPHDDVFDFFRGYGNPIGVIDLRNKSFVRSIESNY